VRAGSLVATPDFRVAEISDIWEHPDRIAACVRPIDGTRINAFSLDELVELVDARDLRPYPKAEVATRWGVVEVRATAVSDTHWGRAYTDKVVVSCPQEAGDGPVRTSRPIRVHRVDYTLSGALARNQETGAWQVVDHFSLYRFKGRGDPTWNAGKAVRDGLPGELAGWLDRHPHFLEEAHRVRLSNQIAEVEAEILAAKLRFEDAHRRRDELLAREAQ
jgi:hypothetical protein